HQLRARLCELLHLDRGGDRIDRVGVGHRLHAHRRVASDRDHARAPHHARLARAVTARRGGVDRAFGDGRIEWTHARSHFNSTRTTLSRLGAPSVTRFPRIVTSVAVALPITSLSGSGPSRPTDSPGASVRDSSRVPRASCASIHEASLARTTAIPAAGVSALGLAPASAACTVSMITPEAAGAGMAAGGAAAALAASAAVGTLGAAAGAEAAVVATLGAGAAGARAASPFGDRPGSDDSAGSDGHDTPREGHSTKAAAATNSTMTSQNTGLCQMRASFAGWWP